MVAMNVVYAASAYPFGKLSNRMSHSKLLADGLIVLIATDAVLGFSDNWIVVLSGVALWGLHMGITQGLLASMVADTAPAELRGTAFGEWVGHAAGQRHRGSDPGSVRRGCDFSYRAVFVALALASLVRVPLPTTRGGKD